MKKEIYLFLLIIFIISLIFYGCNSKETALKEIDAGMATANGPKTKEDGSKFGIAYLDYDEYLPASQQFYYILEGLRKEGWIVCDAFPFRPETATSKEMVEYLAEMDLGPYLEFDADAFYYLAYDGEDTIRQSLIRHTKVDKDIDLIVTFGTGAGLFVKELNLPVPMVDFSATDPVASGIIDSSTEGSGTDNVWAQVEPSIPMRQLKYYYDLAAFQKLGMVIYGDELISGVPDVEKVSGEIGFDIIKYNIAEVPRETEAQQDAHYEQVKYYFEKIVGDDIDAFLLTVDLINDSDRLNGLLDILYRSNIPVFVMDDLNAVKNGGLLIISAYDYENVGYFTADAIGKILQGATAGDLPCIYVSSPYICLNYDVARRIDFPLDFKFLLSCDEIYRSERSE